MGGTIVPVRSAVPRRAGPSAALALAALAVVWGTIPLLVRSAVPASHLVAMRITLGALVLVPVALLRGGGALDRRLRPRLAVLGMLLILHWLAFFLAIKLTTVAVALALVYLGPVLAAVLSGPVLGERVGRRAAIGLLLAVAGLVLVVRPGGGAAPAGLGVGLLAGVLLALLMLAGRPVAKNVGGLTVAAWELGTAAVFLLPFTVQAVRFSAAAWPEFLVLGALYTGVGSVVYWRALGRLDVAIVGIVMYLEPASAMVWAALLLGERPGAAAWIGVALVVAGGVLAALESVGEEVLGAPAAL